MHGGLGSKIVEPSTGPVRNGRPSGGRTPQMNDLDLAIVVLKTEPMTLDRSHVKVIGPPIRQMQGRKHRNDSIHAQLEMIS